MIILVLWVSACTRTEVLELSDGDAVEVECLPVYGNWCGQGYPAYEVTGHMPKPVDVWDATCKAHDLCYDKYGKDTWGFCDRRFARQIQKLYEQGNPVPHALSAAYTLFNGEYNYQPTWLNRDDVNKAFDYSCRGGDGQTVLFCDVGKGRDDCQVDTLEYVNTGNCSCEYYTGIFETPTRYVGKGVYPAKQLEEP